MRFEYFENHCAFLSLESTLANGIQNQGNWKKRIQSERTFVWHHVSSSFWDEVNTKYSRYGELLSCRIVGEEICLQWEKELYTSSEASLGGLLPTRLLRCKSICCLQMIWLSKYFFSWPHSTFLVGPLRAILTFI